MSGHHGGHVVLHAMVERCLGAGLAVLRIIGTALEYLRNHGSAMVECVVRY